MTTTRTRYVIRADGRVLATTESPHVAESYSRTGHRVTAETRGVER